MKKNITFSAEEALIRQAREQAKHEKKTLNDAFREWLKQYGEKSHDIAKDYHELMKKLAYVRVGNRKFTREEMNER